MSVLVVSPPFLSDVDFFLQQNGTICDLFAQNHKILVKKSQMCILLKNKVHFDMEGQWNCQKKKKNLQFEKTPRQKDTI